MLQIKLGAKDTGGYQQLAVHYLLNLVVRLISKYHLRKDKSDFDVQKLLFVIPQKKYHIVQNFDRGSLDIFDAFQPDHQNLTLQYLQVHGKKRQWPSVKT